MVGKTSYILTTLLAASVQISCHAFAPSGSPSGNRLGVLAASSDDAAAQVMSEYMAKSHAEKLRAVREVEQKKNSEIEALKAEIEQLKSAAVPVAAVASGSGGGLFEQRNAKVIASAEAGKSRWGDMEVERAAEQVKSAPSSDPIVAELQEKVESYKKFIADYIVNAQNQKLLAVKEAELKAEKKFQERLEQLFANSGMLLPGSGEDTAPPENLIAAEPTLYDKRNARVIAAATAGKSRWGAMEVEKVEELVKNSAVTTEEVAASVESAESTLFEQRNAKIVAAAGAGKSRWGSKEVERAAQLNGEELKVEDPPKVKKITLEERVNLGARLLEA